MDDILRHFGPELFERYQLVLRLLLAAALGGMIGLERETSGKPAGFRTNLLICLGAALITEISYNIALLGASEIGGSPDPGRIAAQIVSGIGFLGAGSILHSRGGVTGLTTAATLWVVAAIGMAVGARAYLAALVATSLVMLALMLLGRVEDHLIPRRPTERNVNVRFRPPVETMAVLEQKLTALGFAVDTLRVERNEHGIEASFQARGEPDKWEKVVHTLLAVEGVQKVELA
ncbi:MAG: MgtC/SapB family protein [Gemmatimonadota bacterium]